MEENMKIIIEKSKVKTIPVVNVYDAEAREKLPVIIMLHGATGKKEDNLERAKMFVEHGFYVLLFDAYGHGELKVEKNEEKYDIHELLKMYLETSKYINQLIGYYREHTDFGDFNRVGLLGFSMGAHTIYHYIARERQTCIKASVPIIGSPVWKGFVRKFIEANKGVEKIFDERKIVEFEEYITEIQPSSYINNIKDFPLLMLNGQLDERVPIETIRDFYLKASSIYTYDDNINFIEYKGVGHKVTEEMLSSATKWFKKYL